MTKLIVLILTTGLIGPVFGQTDKPASIGTQIAKQGPAFNYMAGADFPLSVHITKAPTRPMSISVMYTNITSHDNQSAIRVSCSGDVSPLSKELVLICHPSLFTVPGDYQAGGASYFLPQTSEQGGIPNMKLPMFHIFANAKQTPTELPVFEDGLPAFSTSQAIDDGVVRTKQLFLELSTRFLGRLTDTPQGRKYLVEKVDDEKLIIDHVRINYEAAIASGRTTFPSQKTEQRPKFFKDFDLRLDAITNHLGATPRLHGSLNLLSDMHPRFVLTQLPHTSDSVEAKVEGQTLDDDLASFVLLLGDIQVFLERFSATGTKRFSFSIISTPVGAEVYYTSLGEETQKWSYLTNIRDETLEYATYTFRIDWHGCWKDERPDVISKANL